MAAVATEAGVSRPTVCYFADRRAAFEATLFFASPLRAGIAEHPPPEHAGGEAVGRCASCSGDPAQRRARRGLGSTLLDASSVAGITRRTAIQWARQALKDLVVAAEWSADEADESVEVMLRMLLSLLTAPEPRRSELELRAFLERRLVPALGLGPQVSPRPTAPRRRPAQR
jgi:hypothetical protein